MVCNIIKLYKLVHYFLYYITANYISQKKWNFKKGWKGHCSHCKKVVLLIRNRNQYPIWKKSKRKAKLWQSVTSLTYYRTRGCHITIQLDINHSLSLLKYSFLFLPGHLMNFSIKNSENLIFQKIIITRTRTKRKNKNKKKNQIRKFPTNHVTKSGLSSASFKIMVPIYYL